jgi:hypothetical protein
MLRARQPAAILFDAAASGVTADLTVTLGDLTLSGDASTGVAGDLTVTLGGIALSADATVATATPVTADLTATLGALSLSADATSGAIIIIDDTHDGDYLGKRLRKERKAVAARRQRVLDLYEQIVEGKHPQPEVVALVEAAGISNPDSIIYAPAIELTGLIKTLERAQQLAERLAVEAAIEADDEEVLLLL